MGWIVGLVAITAFITLWLAVSRPEAGKDWRDQAEGLRQRLERDERIAYDRLNL